MSDKRFTAKEIREAANFYERNEDRVRRVVQSNNVLANIHETIPMLKYAADMVERCEAEIALTDKTHYTYNRLNYILRGDAGKGRNEEH